MLLTVSDFKSRAAHSIFALVEDLQQITGRYGDAEAAAWEDSLGALIEVFSSSAFDPLHLYLSPKGHLSLEYQLPSSSSWADVVLLGAHREQASAVVIELKHWQLAGDQPGAVEGLIQHQGRSTLHPSDQVRGYTEYCRRFHSAVHARNAAVAGCVLFTNAKTCAPYQSVPNDQLAADYPCFAMGEPDVEGALPGWLGERITEPDGAFAKAFELGYYHQDRDFIRQVGQQIGQAEGPFELLDGQREAYGLVRSVVADTAVSAESGRKKVVIVKGPPGSGKSVVAAKTWASLAQDPELRQGNVVFTTTSACQNRNWEQLFEDVGSSPGGGGVVLKANAYFPITTVELGQLRKRLGKDWLRDISAWRDNLKKIGINRKGGFRMPDNQFFVSIVDEAHALINPEHMDSRGQFGFVVAAGPQAYHIIRASEISVFFMDPEQSFRERETTRIEDIEGWAEELGADVVEVVSLEGHQFRCAGSVEYVDWAGRLLSNAPAETVRETGFTPRTIEYRQVADADDQPAGMECQVFGNPIEMERALRERVQDELSARFVSSYARPWATKGVEPPHGLPPQQKDFCESFVVDGIDTVWSKVWNYVPRGTDYTAFIQARSGTAMAADALTEVGCPYVVRGFDFDYIGLLWHSDLVWRGDRWQVQLDHVHESGLSRHLSRARKENDPDGPEHMALVEKVVQGYRILLTRARRGIYFWFEDEETKERLTACLRS